MKPGILKHGETEATCTPKGWQSSDTDFAVMLDGAFPRPKTEVGTPWVRSFYAAANSLGAEIVQQPEPGEWNMGKQQTGGDFLSRFRGMMAGKRFQKTRDASGHEHASDGKFTSGGGGSAKPKERAEAKPDAPKTESKPGEKAKGVLAKLGGKLSALVDKVPVVGHLKRGMQAAMGKIHDVAAKRYGPKTAKAIMASGTVADAVLMGGGALLTGMPIVTGANQLIGIIPAFVLAEGKYQLGKLMGKAMELEGEEFDKACEEIAGMITDAFEELLDKHGDELKAAFPGKALHGGFLKRFSAVLKGKDTDLGDETERINLIADILYHVYGDDAIKFFDEGAKEKAWDAAAHPRGANGRFIPKGSAEAAATAKTQIAETLKKPKTPESHKELAEHLNLLTVKQLGELKKEYQISAAGRTKKELVDKLAERLSKGRTGVEKPEGESPSYQEWGRQERESRKPKEEKPKPQKLTREQRQGEQSAKFALQLAERNGPLDPIVAERLAEQLQGHPRAEELLNKVRAVTRKPEEEKPAEEVAAKQPADLNTSEGKQRFYETVAELLREKYHRSGMVPVQAVSDALGVPVDQLMPHVKQMWQQGIIDYNETSKDGSGGYFLEKKDKFPHIPAPTVSPEEKAKIQQSIKDTFEDMLANHPQYSKWGMVPIHEIRSKIRELHGPQAASQAVLNDAIMDLWRNGKVSLEGISDLSKATPQQLDDSIAGDFATHFYMEPKRGSQPDQKPQGEKPGKQEEKPETGKPDHKQQVLSAFDKVATKDNFVDLADLKDQLPGMSTQEMHAAINQLRRDGVLSGSAREGRHGVTDKQRDASIREGDSMVGFVSRRGGQPKPLHEKLRDIFKPAEAAKPKPAKPKKPTEGKPTADDASKIVRTLDAHDSMFNGLAKLSGIYHELKQQFPNLTPKEFQGFLQAADKERALSLRILNEVRTQTPADKEINIVRPDGQGGNTVYQFAGDVKPDKLEQVAREYFGGGSIKPSQKEKPSTPVDRPKPSSTIVDSGNPSGGEPKGSTSSEGGKMDAPKTLKERNREPVGIENLGKRGTLVAQGATREIKEKLKSRGWKYDGETQTWTMPLVAAHADIIRNGGDRRVEFITGLNAYAVGVQVKLDGKPVFTGKGHPDAKQGDSSSRSTIAINSGTRNVDAYRVGNVIERNGEWRTITDAKVSMDDQGMYTHTLTTRPAKKEEAVKGQVAKLNKELIPLLHVSPESMSYADANARRQSIEAELDRLGYGPKSKEDALQKMRAYENGKLNVSSMSDAEWEKMWDVLGYKAPARKKQGQ